MLIIALPHRTEDTEVARLSAKPSGRLSSQHPSQHPPQQSTQQPSPQPSPSARYPYWLSENGQSVSKSGVALQTELAQLSANNSGEVVAVLNWQSVSWHKVQLPKKAASQVNALLHGLLEDQLLDEISATHLILPSNIDSLIQNETEVIVGACNKAWLRAALLPLQAVGLTIQRIVCELTPTPSTPPALYFLGDASDQSLSAVLCSSSAVQMLPIKSPQWSAFKELRDPGLRILAEPQWAKSTGEMVGREPTLFTTAQRMMQAVQSNWDAATGEWAQSGSLRLARRLQKAYLDFVHAPHWSWSRRTLILSLVVNLIGLNAWAWIERASLKQRESSLSQLVKESFPSIGLVVDPSLQMQREMKKLRHARGQSAEGDLESMLSVAASNLPPNYKLQSLDYSPNELRLNAVSADLISPTNKLLLEKRGYTVRGESSLLGGQSVPVLILTYTDGVKN